MRKGFTLIELMVIISIIGILLSCIASAIEEDKTDGASEPQTCCPCQIDKN
jgi:prepilin-type N-terminal cleavage/methylation domain-containing protein